MKPISGARARANAMTKKIMFSHTYGGMRVTCKCEGPSEFVYGGNTFKSLSAAAVAAAKDFGMKAKHLNGWVFWKAERTKAPTVLITAAVAAATPQRRTIDSIDADEVLDQLSELLSHGCEVTLSKDRDRFITRVVNGKSAAPVLVQNQAASLSVLDAVGKWRRETSGGVKH